MGAQLESWDVMGQISELNSLASYLNSLFLDDYDLMHVLPIQINGENLLTEIRDGTLLGKFVNKIHSKVLDVRALNIPDAGDRLSQLEVTENLNLALNVTMF